VSDDLLEIEAFECLAGKDFCKVDGESGKFIGIESAKELIHYWQLETGPFGCSSAKKIYGLHAVRLTRGSYLISNTYLFAIDFPVRHGIITIEGKTPV
jgi:hypothetical protein